MVALFDRQRVALDAYCTATSSAPGNPWSPSGCSASAAAYRRPARPPRRDRRSRLARLQRVAAVVDRQRVFVAVQDETSAADAVGVAAGYAPRWLLSLSYGSIGSNPSLTLRAPEAPARPVRRSARHIRDGRAQASAAAQRKRLNRRTVGHTGRTDVISLSSDPPRAQASTVRNVPHWSGPLGSARRQAADLTLGRGLRSAKLLRAQIAQGGMQSASVVDLVKETGNVLGSVPPLAIDASHAAAAE